MDIIHDWRNAWRFGSVWLFAIIAAMPELYNTIAALGFMDEAPPAFVWTVRGLAVVGLVTRFVKQHRPPQESED